MSAPVTRTLLLQVLPGLVLLTVPGLLFLGPPVRADEGPALTEAMTAFFQAKDPRARHARAEAIRRLSPDVATVAALLGTVSPWREDVSRGGATTWERETADGVVHTVHAYVPSCYEIDRAWPALLYLHGDVTRDEDGGGAEGIEVFAEAAERDGFLLPSPATRNGAH